MDNGNFAADYNYTDNGNVDIANFHNPQVQSGGGPGTYQWDFGYDGLNRLTDANFEGSSTKFDVNNLTYDKAGNIESLPAFVFGQPGDLFDAGQVGWSSSRSVSPTSQS